jgi:hypothetical protein
MANKGDKDKGRKRVREGKGREGERGRRERREKYRSVMRASSVLFGRSVTHSQRGVSVPEKVSNYAHRYLLKLKKKKKTKNKNSTEKEKGEIAKVKLFIK